MAMWELLGENDTLKVRALVMGAEWHFSVNFLYLDPEVVDVDENHTNEKLTCESHTLIKCLKSNWFGGDLFINFLWN